MQFLTWFVGIATLIAGVFAIGNILLITVKERTKEIGIRRAIGATPIEVRRQVVLESVFLTTVAGMLGIIFGGFVLFLLDYFLGSGPDPTLINPTVDIPVILVAFLILSSVRNFNRINTRLYGNISKTNRRIKRRIKIN